MTACKPFNPWTSTDHARDYLERADSTSHRGEGESALLEFIPADMRRILDLGTGDVRLIEVVREEFARRGAPEPEAGKVSGEFPFRSEEHWLSRDPSTAHTDSL